ncbi:MAG: hypothetical protein ACOYNF_14645, partial [Rhodoferax sp.]
MFNRLTWPVERLLKPMLCLVVAALLVACATETTRRAGLSLIKEGRYEEGLAKLEQDTQAEPKNAEARSDYLRQREQVINRLLNSARNEQANERHEAAELVYRRVLAIDANNQAAKNGLQSVQADQRHANWLADAQAMRSAGDVAGAKSAVALVLVERPTHVKANQMRYQLEEQSLRDKLAGPRLNIKDRKPVSMQFREANLKMVLEAISVMTGVNILIDKDV